MCVCVCCVRACVRAPDAVYINTEAADEYFMASIEVSVALHGAVVSVQRASCAITAVCLLCLQKSEEEPWPEQVRRPRPRINSAVFVSCGGGGGGAGGVAGDWIDSGEWFRRHGSRSRLCRKAHSVDNISDEEQRHFGLPMLSVSGPSPPDDDSEHNDDCL